MKKCKLVIIGSGNIATDLLVKALRSEWVTPCWMVGIDPQSEGLQRAQQYGLQVTAQGLAAVLPQLRDDGVGIAMDASSAGAHRQHAQLLRAAAISVIDLTPAALGRFEVPAVTPLPAHSTDAVNINMISCGGQATIPIVAAVSGVQSVRYAEVVATVASRSVGPGTRQNIDEFTRATAAGIQQVGGAERGKAIIIINPAEPPLLMRNTVHCLTVRQPDRAAITASITAMVARVQSYVPGYQLTAEPQFDGSRVTVFVEVSGQGDYLPAFAGNVDIMTAAALATAEQLAQRLGLTTRRGAQ